MSMRSIVEINHDYSHKIAADPDGLVKLLKAALGSGDPDYWEAIRIRYGIRRIVMAHHSSERAVLVDKTKYEIP